MTDLPEVGGVRLGSRWRREPPGREVVEVRRCWVSPEGPTVRAHPVRGGKVLICPPDYLRENYTQEADDG